MAENKALKLEHLQYIKEYSEKNYIAKDKIGSGLSFDVEGFLNSDSDIIYLSLEEYQALVDSGNIDEDAYYAVDGFTGNVDKAKVYMDSVTATLFASEWLLSKTYRLEEEYPVSIFDIDIAINGDICTAKQKEAFDNAQMVGLSSENSIRCLGDVPTIDIPIIIKVVKKV